MRPRILSDRNWVSDAPTPAVVLSSLPARLDPSYGGPHTFGTETVTAQPGDRTVVNQIDSNSVDAIPHCRAFRVAAHRRYLWRSTGAGRPMVWAAGDVCPRAN